MMKRFWTIVAGSFVGVWLGLIVFSVLSVIFSFAFLGAMSSFGTTNKSVEANSILHLDLGISVTERQNSDMVASIFSEEEQSDGLSTILKAIEEAKNNDKIKGIYIECNGVDAGIATIHEIRNALENFKESGKFIYAYGDAGIDQGDYYVASVADSIFINPIGSVDIHGLASLTPFFKGLLDKIGVEMQIVRVGTFKSAVEPYMLTEMSEANREQQEHYLGNIWKDIVGSISKSRNITADRINEMADSLIVMEKAEYYVQNKLVDGLCYKFEFENKLRALTDVNVGDDLKLVSPSDVVAGAVAAIDSENKIAVIYAEGEIDGGDEGINSEELCKDILKAANDEKVKGVVLRVNSPGGSAFGSEQIWKALEEVKKNEKPFAVSMGDYAASGGYYISCGADRIFAEPVTITGSIGIFGMIPCFENLAKDKLGVNFSSVSTNENGSLTVMQKLTPFQLAKVQNNVNRGYELFTSRCATGRNMPIDSLKSIAEGRVWDGVSAKELGLVDEFGGLENAVKWVAEKASLTEYSVIEAPTQEDKWLKYISKYAQIKMDKMLKENTGELYQYHDVIKRIMSRDEIQCIMEPVEIR